MEKTVYKLLEIEEKAKNIVSRANEEKISLHNAFDKDVADMESKISSENANKVDSFRLQMDKELEREKKMLEEKSKKQLHDLDLFYENNHEIIAQNIFNDITIS